MNGVNRLSRPAYALGAAAVLGAALGGPEADARAAMAAAGTAYEAAPLFLVTWLLDVILRHRLPRFRFALPWLGIAGCGCSRGGVPGALSIPATFLAVLTFGWPAAVARASAALAVLIARKQNASAGAFASADDPLHELELVATSAFAASLAVAALGDAGSRIPWFCLLPLGMIVGAIAPCATAGVAVAAALAHTAPAASAGVLSTAGIVSAPWRLVFRRARDTRGERPAPRIRNVRFAALVLAASLAVLAVRGPSGLVNPRLMIPIGIASLIALSYAFAHARPTCSGLPLAVPIAMLAALLRPQPMPEPRAEATRLDDAYAGERLAFTGIARRSGGRTTLARFAITCCRLDASPVAVTLDRVLDERDGTWVDASGVLVRGETGSLVLHAQSARAIAPPLDPFVYR